MQSKITSLVKVDLKESCYQFAIPQWIDIDRLLEEVPPNRRCINKESLVYFVALIYRKLSNNVGSTDDRDDGFVHLKINYLRKVFRSARENLDYLIENNIVECDGKYSMGNYSFGYRINQSLFDGNVRLYEFNNWKSYKKLKSVLDFTPNPLLKKMPYLSKSFDDKVITIDHFKAIKILNDLKKHKLNKTKIDDHHKRTKIEYTINFQKERVMRIFNNDYKESFMMDKTSNRFHSIITNLKKELRPLIKINGEETESLDLKNSQPFFFLLFFKSFFWSERSNGRVNLKELDKIYQEYIKYSNKTILANPYMIPNSSTSLEASEPQVAHFCKLCRNGIVYDYYLDRMYDTSNWNESLRKEKRQALKKQFLCYLYDVERDARFTGGVRRFTKENFPLVDEFLSILKSYKSNEDCKVKCMIKTKGVKEKGKIAVDSGFKKLSITLQKIESEIFLDRICRQLDNLYPDMYFLTVHDSIIYPKSYKEKVKEVMESVIFQLTGEMPQLSDT